MRLTITGSGGFRMIPRLGCRCRVCTEARKKGYRRLGASMFIHDQNILFDTPEDIAVELEDAGIERIDHLFYTHWHPDHTMGARIMEQANTAWSNKLEWRIVSKNRTTVHVPPVVKDELMQRLGGYFEFWEHGGVAVVREIEGKTTIGDVSVTPLVVESCHKTTTHSTIYVIEQEGVKVVYGPCDIVPLPNSDLLLDSDLMILQIGWWGERMAARAKAGPHYEVSLEQILKFRDTHSPKRLILTHIGDELEMCLEDLKKVEEEHDLEFASDGMVVEL